VAATRRTVGVGAGESPPLTPRRWRGRAAVPTRTEPRLRARATEGGSSASEGRLASPSRGTPSVARVREAFLWSGEADGVMDGILLGAAGGLLVGVLAGQQLSGLGDGR